MKKQHETCGFFSPTIQPFMRFELLQLSALASSHIIADDIDSANSHFLLSWLNSAVFPLLSEPLILQYVLYFFIL